MHELLNNWSKTELLQRHAQCGIVLSILIHKHLALCSLKLWPPPNLYKTALLFRCEILLFRSVLLFRSEILLFRTDILLFRTEIRERLAGMSITSCTES